MNQELIWKIETLWEKACTNIHEKTTESERHDQAFTPQEDSFFVPFTSPDDLSLSDTIAFTDDHGAYSGLAQDGVFHEKTKPFYVFDNHNKALMAFLEIKNQTGSPINVVHIDAHPDDAVFGYEANEIQEITPNNIDEVYRKSRISDFLDCAEKGQLIKCLKRITTEADFMKKTDLGSLEASTDLPGEPFVLSLDIDIFGPEGAFTSLESKITTIAHYWHHALAVTVATSPGFIDQEDAIEFVKVFMKRSEKI